MTDERQYLMKLVVLGDEAVGKTSLISMYIENKFKEDYKPTLGVNILTKDVFLEEMDLNVRLVLWDLAAQAKYDLSRVLFFQGCAGALFVYDITRHSSYSNIESKWHNDYIKYSNEQLEGSYLLIGNKSDLSDSRAVSVEEGEKLANKLKAAAFIETSAKLGKNVEMTFRKLVESVLECRGVQK